jgi:MEDS: MEthanogen/methylotroph, DcmR Sensory domain
MCQHLALFYVDAYPADDVADVFADGLAAGDHCVALLNTAHRQAVEQCLQARGVDLPHPDYTAVDSDDVLAQLHSEQGLDLQRAESLLRPLIAGQQRGNQRVRAAGDLAPTLCAAGHTDDALAFEGLVHRLAVEQGASVICAYPIQLCERGHMHALVRVSAEHNAVEFPDRLWVHHLEPFAFDLNSAA